MSQLPEWMRQIAELGQQQMDRDKQQAQMNKQANIEVDKQSLWSEKTIAREQLSAHIRQSSINSSMQAVKSNALQQLSHTLRGTQYRVASTDFSNESFLVHANIYSKDKRIQAPATFEFVWDTNKRVRVANTFKSGEQFYPLNAQGLQAALKSELATGESTLGKIISRAQIADRLRIYAREQLDPIIQGMVSNNELVKLSNQQFAYTHLPAALAAVPGVPSVSSSAPANATDREQSDQQKTDGVSEQQDKSYAPSDNKPAAPRAPGETEDQYKQRTQTASSKRRLIYATDLGFPYKQPQQENLYEEPQDLLALEEPQDFLALEGLTPDSYKNSFPSEEELPELPGLPDQRDQEDLYYDPSIDLETGELVPDDFWDELELDESCGNMRTTMSSILQDRRYAGRDFSKCPKCDGPLKTSENEAKCTKCGHVADLHDYYDYEKKASKTNNSYRYASGGRDHSKNCKSCGKMFSASTAEKTRARKTCPKCGGELGSPNWE